MKGRTQKSTNVERIRRQAERQLAQLADYYTELAKRNELGRHKSSMTRRYYEEGNKGFALRRVSTGN